MPCEFPPISIVIGLLALDIIPLLKLPLIDITGLVASKSPIKLMAPENFALTLLLRSP